MASEFTKKERRKHATVTRGKGKNKEFLFPIRPGNKSDARDALRLLPKADISRNKKKKVARKAMEVLGHATEQTKELLNE